MRFLLHKSGLNRSIQRLWLQETLSTDERADRVDDLRRRRSDPADETKRERGCLSLCHLLPVLISMAFGQRRQDDLLEYLWSLADTGIDLTELDDLQIRLEPRIIGTPVPGKLGSLRRQLSMHDQIRPGLLTQRP